MEIADCALGREGLVKQEAEEEPVAAFVRLEWFATSMRQSASTPRPAQRLSLSFPLFPRCAQQI